MKNIFMLFFVLCFGWMESVMGQINPDSVSVGSKTLAEGLYEIEMYGCNMIVSSGKDGVLLVDAGYMELAEKLRNEIRKINPAQINYLIDTHWHFDHVGGNLVLGKEATIIATEYTRKLVSKDNDLLGEKIPAHPSNLRPVITFSDKMTLYFNEDTISIIALPGGHSGSDLIVYFKKANVLHIGDIIFSDMFPFCDVAHGGNVMQIAINIEKIVDMFPANVRIIPGHGREYTIKELKEYQNMVTSTYKIVTKEMAAKKTLEEIKKAAVLKDWEQWGVAFTCNDWIEMIYNSAKK